MQERRKYVRLNIPLKISYNIPGKEDVELKSITKNISPNGARFALEERLPKGAIVNINVKIPMVDKPIPIKARIAWSNKEANNEKNLYDTGFEFVQLPEESEKIFFQYLCNLMYDQLKKI